MIWWKKFALASFLSWDKTFYLCKRIFYVRKLDIFSNSYWKLGSENCCTSRSFLLNIGQFYQTSYTFFFWFLLIGYYNSHLRNSSIRCSDPLTDCKSSSFKQYLLWSHLSSLDQVINFWQKITSSNWFEKLLSTIFSKTAKSKSQ